MTVWEEQEHTGADFAERDFSEFVFRRCRFMGCRFVDARLSEMAAEGCLFEECDFSGAWMNAVEFRDSSLPNGTFRGANLFVARFEGCRMLGA
jgi:uncharacterized protein YjbI with pentapeptide repeats